MSDHLIAIGCDSSKGRIDVEIRNHHGTVLHTGVFDDTPDDHAALSRLVDGLRERHPEAPMASKHSYFHVTVLCNCVYAAADV